MKNTIKHKKPTIDLKVKHKKSIAKYKTTTYLSISRTAIAQLAVNKLHFSGLEIYAYVQVPHALKRMF